MMRGRNRLWQVAMMIMSTTCALLPCWPGLTDQYATTSDKSTGKRPNIVVILTDDQGWGDLSVNGNSNIATPNIDSLATDGTSIQHFYVCSVCAPTRAEFLTGRYYPRTGVSGVSRGDERMNSGETTIAEVFRSAGYITGAFGKWHNGTQPPLHPNNRGFDEFYGFTSGHWGHYISPPLDHNGRVVRGNGFIVDDFTDRAIEFISTNRSHPFFCYLPLNTPHSPMMVPDRFYEKFDNADVSMRHRGPEKEDIMMTRAALAMCENIDWNIGRILRKLDDLKLREDTIVVYFSDNGPNSWRWNGGMKGRKGSLDEGGLRSPFFIRWPGKISAGATVSEIAGAIDLLPTLASLAVIDTNIEKPLDGKSLRSLLLRDDSEWKDRSLFSIRDNDVSIRTQQFRLDARGQLFDIASDPGQRTNVAADHKDLVAGLKQQAKEFGAEMKLSFAASADRPFHVGYGTRTTLTARDGVPHGEIQRSAKAPNNSFFVNWTRVEDFISWQIDVGKTGQYEAIVHYTCAADNEGASIQLAVDGGNSVDAIVTEVFDPPLYDKSKERVADSHYFVKDFRPLVLGKLQLDKGTDELRLSALLKPGNGVIDVHSVELNLTE